MSVNRTNSIYPLPLNWGESHAHDNVQVPLHSSAEGRGISSASNHSNFKIETSPETGEFQQVTKAALNFEPLLSETPPSERVYERKLNLKSLTPLEQEKYGPNGVRSTVYRNVMKEFDEFSRTCSFDNTFKQVGLFKILEKEEAFFDLRKIGENENLDVHYYAPFAVHNTKSGELFTGASNKGWLSLKNNDRGGMHICRIDSFAYNIKGIGTALIQFTIEKSIEAGFGGKVTLFSSGGSALFYYKLGFVCDCSEWHQRIIEAYRNDSNERSSLDGCNMHLPEEAIIAWKKKISENPISLTSGL